MAHEVEFDQAHPMGTHASGWALAVVGGDSLPGGPLLCATARALSPLVSTSGSVGAALLNSLSLEPVTVLWGTSDPGLLLKICHWMTA